MECVEYVDFLKSVPRGTQEVGRAVKRHLTDRIVGVPYSIPFSISGQKGSDTSGQEKPTSPAVNACSQYRASARYKLATRPIERNR
jgi:hypothetical protein